MALPEPKALSMICTMAIAAFLACNPNAGLLSEVAQAPPAAAQPLPNYPRIDRYHFLRESRSGRLAVDLRLDAGSGLRFGLWGGMLVVGHPDANASVGFRRAPPFPAYALTQQQGGFFEVHFRFGSFSALR